MKISRLENPEVILIEPDIYKDNRGFFFESFNLKKFQEKTGKDINFLQDNHSKSVKNVLRGLHYQYEKPQGKLVRVVSGSIYDVAVDIRKSSKFFGKWVGQLLSSENKHQLWIPEGFAHGFITLSNNTEVLYKTTDYYNPDDEYTIKWNDASIEIGWGNIKPVLSEKDNQGLKLLEAPLFK